VARPPQGVDRFRNRGGDRGHRDVVASTAEVVPPDGNSDVAPTAKATHQSSDENGVEHAEDVALGPCTKDEASGLYSANATITNHSSKLSNYVVEISILSPDKSTKYDDMLALVTGLAPDQRSPQTPYGTRTDIPDGLVCELTEVTRFAA
jgi:hypothetical protein